MTRHLLVVGAQRSGSTYLAGLLDAHPDITMARPARPEPKVFMSAELTARGAQWYRSTYFAHASAESVLGEKSTSYLEDPVAPARAAAVLGRPEIVAVLRDPVERAVSNWRFSTDHGLETRPLDSALRANLTGGPEPDWDPRETSVSPYAYLERGRFADLLGPWLDQFPDTAHILFLAELLAGPQALAGLYADLGVDPTFRPEAVGTPVNRSLHDVPSLPTWLESELRAYFRDSDAALEKLLGRALPWPTAGAGAD